MAKRRASVRGKGVDIFFEEAEAVKSRKATFYFPQELLEKLDDVWMDLRRKKRKLKKSEIVAAALKLALEEYAEKGTESTLFRELAP
ncbi:MAG TPA: hypothetical protein ENF77_01890 [Candidatus Acetothermia bacterium]|nr:hypothetical protein [Candidatus Bipolaricaulota bacterium]RLA76134.1 MAG: hypothetical protein DRG33_08165 [Deltaproteobacteria bacterium]HDI11056.1 hypothetical protein [Candidatus Acetothermia bacterium]